jgi:hypothetical protein
MQGGGRGIGIVESEIAVVGLRSSSEIEFNSCGIERPNSLLVDAIENVV